MRRLAMLAAGAALATAALPAHATVITCDNLPVMVSCYHWGPNGVEHCDVWVYPNCIHLFSVA